MNLGTNSTTNFALDNSGGCVKALSGAINFRDSYSAALVGTRVTGDNLEAREINLYGGKHAIEVNAGNISGTLNIYGKSAHVMSSNGNLNLGRICMTGDPTYYGLGDFVMGGDISVGEKLTILTGGNISATGFLKSITARDDGGQGYDITMVAGAGLMTTETDENVSRGSSKMAGNSVSIDPGAPVGVISTSVPPILTCRYARVRPRQI